MNVYFVYRLFILGFTLYGLYQFTKDLLKYKPYYERIPNWMKKYVWRASTQFVIDKIAEPQHRKDLIINGILLIILVVINGITFVYY